jgi:hypothetical protein
LCLLLKQNSLFLWGAAPSVTRNAAVPCAQAKLGDSIAFIFTHASIERQARHSRSTIHTDKQRGTDPSFPIHVGGMGPGTYGHFRSGVPSSRDRPRKAARHTTRAVQSPRGNSTGTSAGRRHGMESSGCRFGCSAVPYHNHSVVSGMKRTADNVNRHLVHMMISGIRCELVTGERD